jgi:hypothetical protein
MGMTAFLAEAITGPIICPTGCSSKAMRLDNRYYDYVSLELGKWTFIVASAS